MKKRMIRNLLAGAIALTSIVIVSKTSASDCDTNATVFSDIQQLRGVVYDVGLNFSGNGLSVETYNSDVVEYDIKTIATALHCNAIRIEGEVIERLVAASRVAHEYGLVVLFNPWMMNADAIELKSYYTEAAKAAEKLRKEGVDIIFVAGCEYTIFQQGILPGDTLTERLAGIGALFLDGYEQLPEKMKPLSAKINQALGEFVVEIRKEFKGKVTYAALTFEQIDWSIFDIVGVDHYRTSETDQQYVDHFNSFKVHGKPVFCMEVGSCTYEGAAMLGSGGFMILEGVNPDGTILFKDGITPTRGESEQADYVETQVKLLADNDARGIFVYVFSFPLYPHNEDEANKDLDLVSFSLVKAFPQNDPRAKKIPAWAPKESFHRLADLYSKMDKSGK